MARAKTITGNFADDELLLAKYKLRCHSLEMQKMEMLRIKEDFQKLNIKNDQISKSLTKRKSEYEQHRKELCKTLFNVKLDTDKQQILSRRKINEFSAKRKNLEEHLKMSPFNVELEKLVSRNGSLLEEWKKVSLLLDLTKSQYEEVMKFLIKAFRMKVCEFCETALELKAINRSHDLLCYSKA